jgi:hypothetical protein
MDNVQNCDSYININVANLQILRICCCLVIRMQEEIMRQR